MAWSDYLNEEAYRRFFEKPRFERATEPPPMARFREVEQEMQPAAREEKESWLTKAFERFRTGAEAVEAVREEPKYRTFDPVALSRERAQREAEARERAGARAITFTEPSTGQERSVVPPFDPQGKSEEEINEWLGQYLAGQAKDKAGWSLPMSIFRALTEPRLPEPAREAIRKVPVAGPIAEPHIAATTSPLGGLATLAFPGVTAGMIGGATALGTAGKGLERAGVPVAETPIGRWGPSGVGELAGLVAGPVAGPALGRAALRGAKALPGAARGVAARGERIIPSVRQVVMEEAGGLKPRPKFQLTNDIRTPMEINKRMGQLSKVEKMTAKQQREWNRLLAEKDLNELRAAGTVDDQMDNLLDDITQMEQELELRAVAGEVRPARAPQFGTAERAEWEAARAGKPHGVRPTTRFSGEPIEHLRERLKVYKEFREDMKIVPAGEEAAEPLVTRGRFTERGEVIEEPTFATEGELAGVRPRQAELGIGAGERPIETAGPMFERAAAPKPVVGREARIKEMERAIASRRPKDTPEEVREMAELAIAKRERLEAFERGAAPEPPAPKPAAQAFREATRRPGAPTREEALGRWRGGYEKPAAAPEAARAGEQPVGREEALARWRAGVEGVEPPRVPPGKPPTAEAVPPTGPGDPVGKLIQLIKKAKPVRKETEALKTQVRRKQAAAMGKIFERHPGEAPYRAKGVLKGELPSAAFEPPRNALSEAEMGLLRRQIRSFFEREGGRAFDELGAREALEGILGGKQPTWGEIGTLQAIFGKKLGAALEGKMPPLKRIAREALEIWNLGRTFKATLDQSWHLRQGIRLGARHPKESVREGLRGMKALWSQQTYEDSVRFITKGQAEGRMSPNLFAGRVGPGATTVERTEAYISRWSDVIPGIKHAGREYAASGNFVRGAINENMNRTWTQRLGRKLTEQEMEWTGRVCNWGTGRGPLPDDFRGLLAAIWFAPGYRTAGPAYFSLLVNPKTPGFVRRMVAEEVVAWVGASVGLMTLLKYTGAAEVELDPRSSDWGKIQVGKMRFDIWGGTQQQARTIAQIITGVRKTLSTGEIMDINRQEVAARYVESGYQPSMGLATSLWTGETWEGKPLTWQDALRNTFAPMATEDIIEAVQEEGKLGWIAAPFVHFGVGVWTPDLAGVRVNELTQRYDAEGRHKNQMSSVEFDRLAEEHPDLAKARQDQIDEGAIRGSDWAKFTLKREEGDAEFEKGLLAALLDPKGRTWEQMGRELDDHLYEWAIRSDEFYGELDMDPRDDLDRRINAYYAIEMPAFATEAERSAFFTKREKMLRDDPELETAIHDHKILRFTDSTVRHFVEQKWQADLVANEYYSIPYKVRMPAEQQEQVSHYVEQAEALARMKNLPFRRALMQTGIPQELIGLAVRYKSLPTNKARARFWRQYPTKEELYKFFHGPIPLEIPLGIEQPEMEMVGGR